MDQVNKDTLISLQVEKAKRFLTQADEMVELKHWDLAANRYYYACFHAVQALFIAKGVNAHTHAGINTQFSLHFVKTGIVDISYGSFLARMFQLRQKADYNCAYEISENDILEIIGLSHDFIKATDCPPPPQSVHQTGGWCDGLSWHHAHYALP